MQISQSSQLEPRTIHLRFLSEPLTKCFQQHVVWIVNHERWTTMSCEHSIIPSHFLSQLWMSREIMFRLVYNTPPPPQELLLATLHWCFTVSPTQGLECGAISSTVPLLTHPSPLVRSRTATLLHDLTTPYQGKEEACGHGVCVEGLVNLLSDRDSFVRAQTAAALMRFRPTLSLITRTHPLL